RGGIGGPTAARTWVLPSPRAFDTTFARQLAATDVNGDGYNDLLAIADGLGVSLPSVLYVWLGGANGLAAAPSATLGAPVANSSWAYSVWSAGDGNGDGCGDVLVGGGAWARVG